MKSLTGANGPTLAAGKVGSGNDDRAFILRVDSSGSLDTGFAEGGIAFAPAGMSADIEGLLPTQGDGSLLVTADGLLGFTANGSINTGFGTQGRAAHDLEPLLGEYSIGAAAAQPDGKILIAGFSSGFGSSYVARLTAEGTLDDGFGDGGIVDVESALGSEANLTVLGLGVDSVGRIIVVGSEGRQAAAVRLLADGMPDTSYGPGGTGYTEAPYEPGIVMDFSTATGPFIADDGSFRSYARSTEFMYYSQNLVYEFSPDGEFVKAHTSSDGTGTTIEAGESGLARAVSGITTEGRGSAPPVFGVLTGPRGLFDAKLSGHSFPLSPTSAAVHQLEYVPGEQVIVAVGSAAGFACEPDCPSSTRPAIAKVDLAGDPVAGFGTGGAVLIGQERCAYGTGSSAGLPATPWQQCRVKPPKLDGRIKVFRGKRGPRMQGRVTLRGPQTAPVLGYRLKVKLPKKLRLSSPRRKVKAYGGGAADRVFRKGRTIVVTSGRPVYTWKPYDEDRPAVNGPITVKFGLKAGSLRAIPRRHLGRQLKFAIEGSYLAAAFDTRHNGEFGIVRWFADNSSGKVLKTRAARPRGR